MKRRNPINVGASVRARLLRVSKERREDFTFTLMNYAAERFLARLSRSSRRDRFVLKGAMLLAVQLREPYRPTRDLDLLGRDEPSESAISSAVRDIAMTPVEDDGIGFDLDSLEVYSIREEQRYGGMRATLWAGLAGARIHLQIDIGFGDAITPAVLDLEFPTLLADMPAPNVLAYPPETIVAEKVEAMVDLGLSNSRMKDFADVAMMARRIAFDGDTLTAALRATFGRRGTAFPERDVVALSGRFAEDERAQANWRAFVSRNQPSDLQSLADVVTELRAFLLSPLEHARSGTTFRSQWTPGGPWHSR
jgi:hypothetical protein